MKIGIIGSGHIAVRFAAAVKMVDGVEVCAAASTKIEKFKEFCRKHEIPKAYGSWEEMLAGPEVDAIYVSVINIVHKKAVIMTLKAGKPVICEKPMGLSYTDTMRWLRLIPPISL